MIEQRQSNPGSSPLLPPTIRRAQPGDAEGIGRVHARSQHATYRGIVSDATLARITVEERTDWWTRALTSRGDDWLDLVAEVEEGIVGFSSTGPVGFSYGATVASYDLYCLYMAPEWERRGLGRALLGRTFCWLREHHVPDIQVLCVRETPAHRFYEAMGGQLVEEGQHADDDGTLIPHFVYRYELGDEPA